MAAWPRGRNVLFSENIETGNIYGGLLGVTYNRDPTIGVRGFIRGCGQSAMWPRLENIEIDTPKFNINKFQSCVLLSERIDSQTYSGT